MSRPLASRAALAFLLMGLAAAAFPARAAAGPWTVGAGRIWTKLTYYFHDTRELYWRNGQRIPIFNEGHSTNMAVFAEAVYGLHDRVDLWLQVPFAGLLFDDAAGDRDSYGFGDIRAMVRLNLLKLGRGQLPVSLRLGAKLPTGDFDNDPEIVPLGEGQWDFHGAVELGVSLWPRPGYAAIDLGYRLRTQNATTRREPGDEFFLLVDTGYRVIGGWYAKVVVDALFGKRLREAGFPIPSSNREIAFLQPEVAFEFGDSWFVELGVRLPVHGRNFPAGRQWLVGVSRSW